MNGGTVGDYDGPDAPWNQASADETDARIIISFHLPIPRVIAGLGEDMIQKYAESWYALSFGVDVSEMCMEFGSLEECSYNPETSSFDVVFFRESMMYGAAEYDHDEDGRYVCGFEVDDDDWEFRDLSDDARNGIKSFEGIGGDYECDYVLM